MRTDEILYAIIDGLGGGERPLTMAANRAMRATADGRRQER